jgi:ATP-dependent DNA helicase RecQ
MHHDGSGIVYVATRGSATKVASALRDHGVTADAYHGALPRRERTMVHEQFLDGHTRVVAATNAFGMGIDKPDVRFVFHFDVPGSLDAYYQEIGRAARDGRDADAKLLYDARDLGVQRFFAGGRPDPSQFDAVFGAVNRARLPASPTSVVDVAGIGRTRGLAIVDALTRAEVIARDGRGRISGVCTGDASTAVAEALEAEEARARTERSRVEMMRLYAETRWCRRAVLLGYYGDDLEPPCGRCDNCRTGLPNLADRPSRYDVGMPVVHDEWGDGVVMFVLPDTLVVLFDDFGYRTLSTELVEERELLVARSS